MLRLNCTAGNVGQRKSCIQIQPMLRLNSVFASGYFIMRTNSNTTNVKVKQKSLYPPPTTSFKIQIQPMLRLNVHVPAPQIFRIFPIQIQPMLRLNVKQKQ